MKMLAITRLTVREGLRKRLLYLFLTISTFMILVMLSPGNVRLNDSIITESNLMARVGLWITLTFTSFLAVFVSMNAIGSEVERGSIHLALVRPVSRSRFWLERWMGATALAWLNAALMLGALMISLGLRFGAGSAKQVLPGCILFPLPIACLTALVITINTRLPLALAGFGGIVIALLGFFRGQLQVVADAESGVRGWVMQLLVWISPPLNRVVSQVTQINSGESLDFWVMHECMLYLYVMAAAGLILFSRREV
jgi:ABC-type transport system involved in multi-copper enzyme maturation permease subunit